ncbi:MAG TPA: hypothetical protein VIE65_12960 [Methylobacter sp.]|jgi:hypothetical protein
MSKRRSVNDLVWIDEEDEDRFLGRIDMLSADQAERCLKAGDPGHDPDCKNWPNVEILTDDAQPTGAFCYHVSECEMHDSK